MSITTDELNRIINAKNLIKTKSLDLGIITDEEAKIDDLATAINNITNLGAINLTVDNEQPSQHTIQPVYTSGGTISIILVTHMYYGDLRLPKIPQEDFLTYPYCFIRESSSYYDLIMSKTSFYYDASNTRFKDQNDEYNIQYRINKSTANTATSWGSPIANSYAGWTINNSNVAVWANHNVPYGNGSSTIYLRGSEPVLDISGAEFVSMLEEVL